MNERMAAGRLMRSGVRAVTHAVFAVFLVLALATPSWRVGPFTWWPVVRFPMLAGRPADVGLLSLLPGVVILGWLGVRLFDRHLRPWQWGRPGITLPLLGLTLLVLMGLDPAPTWRTVVQTGALSLSWLTYLFILNERPRLTVPLVLVTLVQGGVALGQFLLQDDVGLVALGEPSLDPAASGVTVLWARDRRWLRAYGLTGHPNFLGATLAVLLLLLLQELGRAQGWRRVGLTAVLSVGLAGLLTSFSRASWLAFGVGLLVWIVQVGRGKRWGVGRKGREGERRRFSVANVPFCLIVPLLVAVGFVLIYGDLVISRFVSLDTPIEARSLDDRSTDAALALEVMAAHPWRGVGAGNYLAAVRSFEPDSRVVHNVPLLVAAELGLPGAALWLWLAISGLRASSRGLAPWLAMLIVSLFDVGLWLSAGWRAAIVFGVLLALSTGCSLCAQTQNAPPKGGATTSVGIAGLGHQPHPSTSAAPGGKKLFRQRERRDSNPRSPA